MPDDTPDAGLRLVLPARRAPLSAGLRWIARGWRLFRAAPLMWIISIVALLVVTIVVNLLPLVGSIAFGILNPVILAGFVAGCRSLERGEEFEIDHLWPGSRAASASWRCWA